MLGTLHFNDDLHEEVERNNKFADDSKVYSTDEKDSGLVNNDK